MVTKLELLRPVPRFPWDLRPCRYRGGACGTPLVTSPANDGHAVQKWYWVEAMPDIVLFLYAGAVGFIVAGLAAGAYRAITSEPVRFGAKGSGLSSVFAALVVGFLLGPAIIVRQAFASVRSGDVPSSWAAAGVMVAVLWSCVLGIAILAVAESLRNSLV
jgi:hypothetical protein